MILWLVGLALASPSRRGVLPSASPVDFEVTASSQTAIGGGCFFGCSLAVGTAAMGGFAATDRVVVDAGVFFATDVDYTSMFGVLGSVRGNVVETEGFRLAPYLLVSSFVTLPIDRERRLQLGFHPGIALEAGGDRVLFDLSAAPLQLAIDDDREAAEWYRGSHYWARALPLVDIGLSIIGKRQRSRFRISPVVPTWTWTADHWWVTVGGASILFYSVGQVEVGARW